MGFSKFIGEEIGRILEKYNQQMLGIDSGTSNMWNRVRDNPSTAVAIENEAYQEGMRYPIGHSMSIPVQRQEAYAAARKYPLHRRSPSGGGKFGNLFEKLYNFEKPYNIEAEEAWNRGWNRAVEEQKRRLKVFNSTNAPYQTAIKRRYL